MNRVNTSLVVVVLAAVSSQAVAQDNAATDCSSYPIVEGLSIEEVEGGLKILSTARADVLIGDAGELQSSLREAQLYAEAAIAEFLNKSIQSEDSLDTSVATSVKVTNGEKKAAQDRVKVQLRSIRTSASALLSGVAPLGNCYTSGEFVLFTVGVKPELVAGASGLLQSMEAGASATGAENTAAQGANIADPGAVEGTTVEPSTGFSNTDGLKDF